jgi:hypothetical protein
VWVDYKSLFLFGELLLGEDASFSERAWNSPPSVVHTDGTTMSSSAGEGGRDYAFPARLGAVLQVLPTLRAIVESAPERAGRSLI